MRKLCASLLFLFLVVCSYAEGIAEEASAEKEKADLSYSFGMLVGSDMKSSGISFDYGAFTRGLMAVMEGQPARFTMEEALKKVQTAFQAALAEQAESARQEEVLFLKENGAKPGVITTESGLQYEVLTAGTGASPVPGDRVKVNYRGELKNGKVFDSSYERGTSEEFTLDQVIPGWAEGLSLMKPGGAYRLFIPSNLGYGADGVGDIIPPYATLIFDVELLEIIPEQPSPEE